jgi:Kef-type K+ transport system membrane component KefB
VSPTAEILKDLFVLFLAAKAGGIIFARIKQPAVLGELLAGMIVGPFVFGLVGVPGEVLTAAFHGDAAAAEESLSLVFEVMAELGLVILLFFVGLETRVSDLMAVKWRAMAVGTLGIVIPFGVGAAVMIGLGSNSSETLFVAAAVVATSSGITARVLRDLGFMGSREARIILGAAIIDDILAFILLAVVIDINAGGRLAPLDIALIAGQAIGFTIFVALVGRKSINRYSLHFQRIPIPHAPLVIALTIMLGLAAASGLLGLSAIIGAFLAGMLLAETTEHYRIEHEALPIYEFLVPFFFAITGTLVDPLTFVDGRTIGILLLLTGAAIFSKLVGAGLGSLGMQRRSAAIVGMGMVPRGEVGIVVASLGLGLGVISRDIFSIVVAMSILTTLAVPPVLSWLVAPLAQRPIPSGEEPMASMGRLPEM